MSDTPTASYTPPARRSPSTLAGITLLLVLALAVRMAYVCQIRGNPFFYDLAVGTDEEVFGRIALKIVGGDWLAGSAGDSPLYPCVLLPLIYWLTSADLLYVRLIQALLGSVTAVGLYFLGRRVGGHEVGVLSGVVAALYAPFIVYDAAILGESSLILLTVAALLCLCRAAEQPTIRNFALAGLTLGLAVNAKPTALAFVPFALSWLFLSHRQRPTFVLTRLAVLCLVALLTVVPFIYRAYRISGKLFPVRGNSGVIFLMGNNPTANGAFKYPSGEFGEHYTHTTKDKPLAERDRIAYRMAWDFIRDQPGAFLKLTARKLWLFWSPTEVGNNLSITYYRQISLLRYPPFLTLGVVLPFAIVGLVLSL
ncbi:MAG: glycosyltransferase family 39 protein, partial [Planctomycetes bacterium]|nr:glycosyltransferase family 39 protein [Planctomycetota bacterium]